MANHWWQRIYNNIFNDKSAKSENIEINEPQHEEDIDDTEAPNVHTAEKPTDISSSLSATTTPLKKQAASTTNTSPNTPPSILYPSLISSRVTVAQLLQHLPRSCHTFVNHYKLETIGSVAALSIPEATRIFPIKNQISTLVQALVKVESNLNILSSNAARKKLIRSPDLRTSPTNNSGARTFVQLPNVFMSPPRIVSSGNSKKKRQATSSASKNPSKKRTKDGGEEDWDASSKCIRYLEKAEYYLKVLEKTGNAKKTQQHIKKLRDVQHDLTEVVVP